MDELWTPSSTPPPGYKLVIHRYHTEIVPNYVNIPQTPVKTHRFMYESYIKQKIINNDKNNTDNNKDNDEEKKE
jgi:hypothetical protein